MHLLHPETGLCLSISSCMLPNYSGSQELCRRHLLLRPDLFTVILSVIGTYVILRSRYDKEFRTVSHHIQDDLEHERLLLLQRQQFSQEENVAEQMEVATLRNGNRISHALHDQIGHTLSASIMQLEALQNYHQ